MHEQMVMGVRDGFADLNEQRHLFVQSQRSNIDIDGGSINEVHRKVRLAVAGVTGVEQAGDSRVVERCQNLPFSQEAVAEGAFVSRRRNLMATRCSTSPSA